MTVEHPALWDKMRVVADAVTTAVAVELRAKADALEEAVTRAYSEEGTIEDTKRMLGCWARARGLWSKVTGEPLV